MCDIWISEDRSGLNMEDRKEGAVGHTEITSRHSTPAASTNRKLIVRHAAIRNALPTSATYRSWSVKARRDWEQQK
jgi:hypothetical protein